MERKDYEKIVKKCSRFTLKKDLKVRQKDNILKYIAKDIRDNDIIGFADETFSNNGKNGVLIAKHAIYQDYQNAKVPYLGLKDITYVSKGKSSMDITFHYEDGHTLTYFMTLGKDGEAFIEVVKEIASQYNDKQAPKESKTLSSSEVEALFQKGEEAYKNQDYKTAYTYYLEASNYNHSLAMVYVGYCYRVGEGIKKDLSEAKKWYEKAIELNDPQGYYQLGRLYDFDEKKYELAAINYKKATDLGHVSSMNHYAYALQYGLGITQDISSAIFYYEKATEKGDRYAPYNLGRIYQEAISVSKDINKAIEYYQLAASRGHAGSCEKLYFIYYIGNDVEKNDHLALQWTQKGLELGSKNCKVYLGVLYASNQFGEEKLKEGIKLLLEGVENKSEYATEIMLIHLENKDFEVTPSQYKDIIQTAKEFPRLQKCIERLENNDNDETLGYRYYEKQDYEKAYHYLLKAANNGNAKCMNKIALMYELGKYVQKDYPTALEWYQKAGDHGFYKAYGNIGHYYEYIEINDKEAFKWYEKAAILGDSMYQYKVGLYYENGIGVEKDISKAKEWYTKSANSGNARGYYYLGKLYNSSSDLPQDKQKAYDCFITSIKLGEHQAYQELIFEHLLIGCARGEFKPSKDDLLWIYKEGEKLIDRVFYLEPYAKKVYELATSNTEVEYMKKLETKVKPQSIPVKEVQKTIPKDSSNTERVEEVKVEKKIPQPKTREKSAVEQQLIDIFKTSGFEKANSPEVKKLIDFLKEEIEDDLFLGEYELVIEKYQSMQSFRYSEACIGMAECYYQLDQHEEVINLSKKINLNAIDFNEYSVQLGIVAEVLYENEDYLGAYPFAKAAVDGGNDDAKEIMEVIEEEHPDIINKIQEKNLSKQEQVQKIEPKIEVKPIEKVAVTTKVESVEKPEKKEVKVEIEPSMKKEAIIKPKETTQKNSSKTQTKIVIHPVHGLCDTCERCLRTCNRRGIDAISLVDGIATVNYQKCVLCKVCLDKCLYRLIQLSDEK